MKKKHRCCELEKIFFRHAPKFLDPWKRTFCRKNLQETSEYFHPTVVSFSDFHFLVFEFSTTHSYIFSSSSSFSVSDQATAAHPKPSVVFSTVGENATVPRRFSNNAAGLDLFTRENHTIQPGSWTLVPTGIRILQYPEGCYGRLAGRSSLAILGVEVNAGVIDPDYGGEIQVVLTNRGQHIVNLARGDRVAQLIFEQFAQPTVFTVDSSGVKKEVEMNDFTCERGVGAFGSTGK